MSATAFQRMRREKAKAEAAPAITREDIANMPKSEVIDLLAAHGVEGATGKVADLREKLTAIMFVGG